MSLGFETFLIFLIIVLLLCLSWSVYLNVKLGMTILKFEDSLDECLDIIDERYASISQVLEIPIFFDSVEVRQVVSDIMVTRKSLLDIASKLTSSQEEDAENAAVKGEVE